VTPRNPAHRPKSKATAANAMNDVDDVAILISSRHVRTVQTLKYKN